MCVSQGPALPERLLTEREPGSAPGAPDLWGGGRGGAPACSLGVCALALPAHSARASGSSGLSFLVPVSAPQLHLSLALTLFLVVWGLDCCPSARASRLPGTHYMR